MKCLVLAGGSSGRLWPLSRKDYPKQFMEIREGRSMFQDTILRNIPYCDEFVILTNKRYENVVRGQLTVFQDLPCTVILEEITAKTAPVVVVYLQQCDPEEEILIVPTDSIIEGDYHTSVTALKESVKNGEFAALVCKPTNYGTGFNYVLQNKKVNFGVKPSKNAMWDTGIWGAKVSVFLKFIDKDLVSQCEKINFKRNVLEREDIEKITPVSLTKCVIADKHKLISIAFDWTRITDISSFYNYYDKVKKNNNVIKNNSSKAEIINTVNEQLVIANGLKNVAIVNTRDAIYVTDSTNEADIKSILNKYGNQKKAYFDLSPKIYETWGTEELIGSANDCKIKTITLYPKNNYEYKLKKNFIANFFIIQGRASLEYEDTEQKYSTYDNIKLTENRKYVISNHSRYSLVMISTEKIPKTAKTKTENANYLVKLQPAFKDNLWGGTKIRDYLGKDVGNMDVIAESWELSAHPAGESKIASGDFAGKTLSDYIFSIGKEKLGWKAQNYDKFPLMVKFIDAKDNLSVQVHPADEYAMTVENEFGKNEMWHILDADEDSFIYDGFNRDVTAEEIRERIKNNTLTDVLNKSHVKKGETYFLKAGTVHEIGSGCYICEIYQSSNVMYRLYEFGINATNVLLGDMHVVKALYVLNMNSTSPKPSDTYETIVQNNNKKRLIGQCKYFTVNLYDIDGEISLPSIESSFQVFINIFGTGTISDGVNSFDTKLGDTWFCASKQKISLQGKFKMLVVNV